ncbi:hypothetical protein X753_31075 [Mesorhizobium sp. LNJC399B00]|nr:hypothetical protein X753_31075 [Mesorhizobium sp. LNJC399B00]
MAGAETDPNDAGSSVTSHDVVDAETLELPFDEGCSIFHREDLRVLAEVAPPLGQFALEFGGMVRNWHSISLSMF